MEGLLSTGPTPSSFNVCHICKIKVICFLLKGFNFSWIIPRCRNYKYIRCSLPSPYELQSLSSWWQHNSSTFLRSTSSPMPRLHVCLNCRCCSCAVTKTRTRTNRLQIPLDAFICLQGVADCLQIWICLNFTTRMNICWYTNQFRVSNIIQLKTQTICSSKWQGWQGFFSFSFFSF